MHCNGDVATHLGIWLLLKLQERGYSIAHTILNAAHGPLGGAYCGLCGAGAAAHIPIAGEHVVLFVLLCR